MQSARSGVDALRRRPVARGRARLRRPGARHGRPRADAGEDALELRLPPVRAALDRRQAGAARVCRATASSATRPGTSALPPLPQPRGCPHIPLWNPYIAAGRPFQANAQSAVFSPYNLPAYVLPFWTALGVIAVLKLWVAAFGMFLLGRALGMRFGGALLAGIVFALNLWMVTWLSYPHMSVWTLVPWMLLLTDRLVRRPDLLSGAGLAAVVGVQFLAGHPESSFHALLATVAFLVAAPGQATRAGRRRGADRSATMLAFGGARWPARRSPRSCSSPSASCSGTRPTSTTAAGTSIDHHLSREFALGLFLPDYWGRPTATPIRPFLLERAVYVGALPLCWRRPRWSCGRASSGSASRAVRRALAGRALRGPAVPPDRHAPARLLLGPQQPPDRALRARGGAAAGWGLDDLASGPLARARAAPGARAVGPRAPAPGPVRRSAPPHPASALGERSGGVGPLPTRPASTSTRTAGRACIEPCTEPGNAIRLASLIVWLTLAGAGSLLIWLRFRARLGPAAFAVLAVLLVCVDLFHAGMGYNPAIDRDCAEPASDRAIRLLERDRSTRAS